MEYKEAANLQRQQEKQESIARVLNSLKQQREENLQMLKEKQRQKDIKHTEQMRESQRMWDATITRQIELGREQVDPKDAEIQKIVQKVDLLKAHIKYDNLKPKEENACKQQIMRLLERAQQLVVE